MLRTPRAPTEPRPTVHGFHSTMIVDKVTVVMKTVAELTDLFRDRGLRVTPQRQAIFGLLQDDASHPTVEALYDRARVDMPTISLKTVYQTVHDLEALGELHVLDLGTGSLRVDPNVEDDHHHLVCTACGRVRDRAGRVRRPASARPVPPRLHRRRRPGDLPRSLRDLSLADGRSRANRSRRPAPRSTHRCPSSTARRRTTT